jgi:molybdate transport system permease protein
MRFAAVIFGLTDAEWQAVRLSCQVGLCAVIVSIPPAVAISYWLARSASGWKWLIEVSVNLPLVMPPVVTGYLLLMLLSPAGPLGRLLEAALGVRIVFSWWGAALAAAVVSFPLMVRAMRLSIRSVDPRLELVAQTLGAGRLDAFFSVTLPLARPGIIAGCVLCFARSLGEFGATIMLAGNSPSTRTIPLAIFSLFERPGAESQVWRLVAISIALSAAALVASEWLERRQSLREAT